MGRKVRNPLRNNPDRAPAYTNLNREAHAYIAGLMREPGALLS